MGRILIPNNPNWPDAVARAVHRVRDGDTIICPHARAENEVRAKLRANHPDALIFIERSDQRSKGGTA